MREAVTPGLGFALIFVRHAVGEPKMARSGRLTRITAAIRKSIAGLKPSFEARSTIDALVHQLTAAPGLIGRPRLMDPTRARVDFRKAASPDADYDQHASHADRSLHGGDPTLAPPDCGSRFKG